MTIQEIHDSTLQSIFGRDNYEYPVGRLFKTDKYFAVLSYFPSDAGTPVVKTYAKNGNKIDSLWVFDDRPATTIGIISKQYATITKDKLIQFTDSSYYLDS